MGTRCITTVYSNDNKPLCCLYRQFDGYPDGHGQELRELVAGKVLVDGLTGDDSNVANGMGCLAAQVVAKFKSDAGGFYLIEPDAKLGDWCTEYHYHVRFAGLGNPATVTHEPQD